MSLQERQDPIFEFERLVKAGSYFEAHEAMEDIWIEHGRRFGDVWQGLTQLAVSLTHASRGNHRGAARVNQKAMAKLNDAGREEEAIRAAVDLAQAIYEDLMAGEARRNSD
ncbi:MAG: DUF309 domain-containing protein [Leptospirales bacterium]|jgi:predicted metal-dependent hydrolase